MSIHFVGRKNIDPGKHLNLSGLLLNPLGTPILTVNFFNVLNSLDSEQCLESKSSYFFDKKLTQS